MIAAGVVLAGCASADGGEGPTSTTTSPAVIEESGNPWDLPVEQRPALFDPCAEIPVEAVEEGLGGPIERVDSFTRHAPGELKACGWRNPEVQVTVLSTWKSRSDYLADRVFEAINIDDQRSGRPSLRMVEKSDPDGTCLQLFFTASGTVWIKVDSIHSLRQYKGKPLVPACTALDDALLSLTSLLPKGDYR